MFCFESNCSKSSKQIYLRLLCSFRWRCLVFLQGGGSDCLGIFIFLDSEEREIPVREEDTFIPHWFLFLVCVWAQRWDEAWGVLSSAAFRHCLPPAPGWPKKSHQPYPGLVWLQNFQGPLSQGIHSACSHLHLALPLACAYILLAKLLSCMKRSQTVRLRRSKDWIKNWCLGDPAVVWNLIQLK